MKKIHLLTLLALSLVMSSKIMAQDFKDYNLHQQKPVLYNPAYAVDKPCLDIFINYRQRWAGFDGAPKTPTLSIHKSILNGKMGLGGVLVSDRRGLTENLQLRLDYGYRATLGKEHYLLLGAALGILNDRISSENAKNIDMSDPQLASDAFNATTFAASAGAVYRLKALEVGLVLPQLFERNDPNFYTLLSAGYQLQFNDWGLRPAALVRGVNTTPTQFDFTANVDFKRKVWAQVGYRSNSSLLAGLGLHYKAIELGYMYEMNGKELAAVSSGTHEIYLGYCMEMKDRKKTAVSGSVLRVGNNAPVVADVVVYENDKEIARTKSAEQTGNYQFKGKQGRTYKVTVTANKYYPEETVFSIADGEKEKQVNFVMTPDVAVVKILTQRADNKKPVVTDITITENGTPVSKLATDANGNLQLELKTNKTYKIEASGKRIVSASQTLELKKGDLEKNVTLVVTPIIAVIGVIESKDNVPVRQPANMTIYANDTLEVKKLHVDGTFNFDVEWGKNYDFMVTPDSTGFFKHKRESMMTTPVGDTVRHVIRLSRAPKGGLDLGNIGFKSGTFELTDESFPTLDALAKLMTDAPDIKVEISGHTDNDGSAQINRSLSQKRAQACVDYVANKGIERSRMFAKGYGFDRPLVPNDSPENKAKNRRVEFCIVD